MKDLFGYIKLGRLSKPIANKISRTPANIYIDYDHLRHIENGKSEYLTKIKTDALTYVKNIIDGYSEIRKGRGDALLLVMKMENENPSNQKNDKREVIVVELQLIVKKNIYTVKTAMPRIKFAKNETLLYQMKKD